MVTMLCPQTEHCSRILAADPPSASLGTERRRAIRWRDAGEIPQVRTGDTLAQLYDLHERLLRFCAPDDARAWMHAPSNYLGGFTPEQALRAGESKRASVALEALETGAFI